MDILAVKLTSDLMNFWVEAIACVPEPVAYLRKYTHRSRMIVETEGLKFRSSK